MKTTQILKYIQQFRKRVMALVSGAGVAVVVFGTSHAIASPMVAVL